MVAVLLKEEELSIPQVIEVIDKRLPVSTFTKIKNELGLPDKDFARFIRVPESTLVIRKKSKFSFEESEKLFRVQRLLL